MATKKLVRELNSLIRFDQRKRLSSPPAKAAIPGQTGVGVAGDEVSSAPPLPELVYLLHVTSDTTADIYSFDKDGGTPVLIGSASPYIADLAVTTIDDVLTTFVGGLESEINDGDSAHTAKVAKNGSLFIDETYNVSRVMTTSEYVIIQTQAVPNVFNKYNIETGAYINTILSESQTSVTIAAANDFGILYYETNGASNGWSLKDLDGFHLFQMIAPSTSSDAIRVLACAGKYMFLIPELTDATSFPTVYQITFHVYNNLGSLVSSFVWDYNDFYAINQGAPLWTLCTEDRFYLIGADTLGNSVVLIYELTANISAGVITSCSRGALLHTITLPGLSASALVRGSVSLDAANFPIP